MARGFILLLIALQALLGVASATTAQEGITFETGDRTPHLYPGEVTITRVRS